MAKKKYLVDGTSLTRSTDRTYTHAVIRVVDGTQYFLKGCCGRLDLALKTLAYWQKEYPKYKYEIREMHEVVKEKRDQ